jgi:thymidylate synthase ThyX
MAGAGSPPVSYVRRVYPLDAHELTEEQIAVAFAMTSRRPEPFDEIARQVSQEKAADFHERWVLGYGHASVAEHAVLHLAVENISRLACDTLEDNRLASYTEKSSRYQVMPPDYFYLPTELAGPPYSPPFVRGDISMLYQETCRGLFDAYRRLIDGCMDHLRRTNPQREGERAPGGHGQLPRRPTGCHDDQRGGYRQRSGPGARHLQAAVIGIG